MADVKLINVNKIYDNKVQAVHDFNLDIKDKEFTVFVGPSGCGKSTTLRRIAGLEEITTGELYIDGVFCNYVPPKDRGIAMVFQTYALYPHRTVFDNRAFSLKIKKFPFPVFEEEAKNRLKEINRKLDALYDVLDKKLQKKKKLEDIKNEYNEYVRFEKSKNKEPNRSKRDKYEKKLAGFSQLVEECNHLQDQIDIVQDEFKQAKTNAKVCTAIDKKRIAQLSKEISKLKKNNSPEDIVSRKEEQLKEAQTIPSPVYKLKHRNKNEIKERIHQAAKILDIENYLGRKPRELSGGQRQRVALGRAIVRNAKVFLMDEPLSNLDAKLRVSRRSEIIKLHKKINATTIYVTHDQTEARTRADKIVVRKDGYIQQVGTPKEIYSHPVNKFVAGFIGAPARNFIEVLYQDGKIIHDGGEEQVDAERIEALKAYNGKKVILGIRPEDIQISSDKGSYPISIDVSELLGSELLIHFSFCGANLTAKCEADSISPEEKTAWITFKQNKIHFFDKETEKTIL